MSAREFKFGDRVTVAPSCNVFTHYEGNVGVITNINANVPPFAEALPFRVVFENDRWHQFSADELEHQPSAQPHVAAGRGFKERLSAVIDAIWIDDMSLKEANDAIDALLAEVVELPEPDEDVWSKNGNVYMRVSSAESKEMSNDEALQLAAALIRAATSSDPSA